MRNRVTANAGVEAAMKRVLVLLALMVAPLLTSATAHSEEKATGLSGEYDQYKAYELDSHKDQCLIVAKNCRENDDVLKRVDRLNNEIEKGSSVYSPEELKSFQEQLNWIYYESDKFPAVRL